VGDKSPKSEAKYCIHTYVYVRLHNVSLADLYYVVRLVLLNVL